MSIQAIAWVLEHSEAALADRLVLLAIANHADARGWNAYPAIPLIAAEARVGRTTVYRSIDSLESSGELAVHRRPGRSNMYAIAALQGSQIGTGKGSQIGTGGVPNTRKRGPRLAPEPSVTVNEPRHEPADVDPDTLERDAEGRWFVQTGRPNPKPVSAMPPDLPDDVKARGAEFFQALRKGERPA